ncbi:putative E3 ubiquitin-protein ligase LUL2 [Hordeum vulgare]|uniref:Predicted protein n=1 Tax=Hordeum vulgare subsp. vulgare TaxID=112509 RepID=F2E2C5_HORVV|nr:uncharacterized protein LOC123403241 [Hordeum vulgare subsp. vulgare]KAE8790494.1 putative E3 ubiquitin-protein ligase LUL2 [Hordeum vulgare]BAK01497.1 predicted protein [Hordeum vulgare subsp. vulgare]
MREVKKKPKSQQEGDGDGDAPMGNVESSACPSLPPPRPHIHGVPSLYYHQYPLGRPGTAAPPPVSFPMHVERHRAVAVSAGVNVKGHTMRLELRFFVAAYPPPTTAVVALVAVVSKAVRRRSRRPQCCGGSRSGGASRPLLPLRGSRSFFRASTSSLAKSKSAPPSSPGGPRIAHARLARLGLISRVSHVV